MCSFVHFALALGRGLHALFRAHQRQIIDFTPGRPHALNKRAAKGLPTSRWLRQLGVTDQVVEWVKPARRPDWMTAAQFAAVTPTLELRELRYRVNRPGFRVDEVTLVTTLLDPVAYPAEALAKLYGVRWQVEVCRSQYDGSTHRPHTCTFAYIGSGGVNQRGMVVSRTP